MLRDPHLLLAHLEGKLSEEEKVLLRDMQRLAEGAAEVSEEQVRARLRAVPAQRWDLLEATIMARTEAKVQAYEEAGGRLRRFAGVLRQRRQCRFT